MENMVIITPLQIELNLFILMMLILKIKYMATKINHIANASVWSLHNNNIFSDINYFMEIKKKITLMLILCKAN